MVPVLYTWQAHSSTHGYRQIFMTSIFVNWLNLKSLYESNNALSKFRNNFQNLIISKLTVKIMKLTILLSKYKVLLIYYFTADWTTLIKKKYIHTITCLLWSGRKWSLTEQINEWYYSTTQNYRNAAIDDDRCRYILP